MDIRQFQKLIDRYLKREATPIEKQTVDKWLSDNPGILQKNERETALLEEGMRREILRRIRAKGVPRVSKTNRLRYFIRAAAAVMLIAGAALYIHHIQTERAEPKTWLTFQTPQGRKARLSLSDGSTVWLNANSVLRYPERFEKDRRAVCLDKGEAFFEIEPKEKQPFTVHAQQLATRVLGTSFTIRMDSLGRRTIVTVNSGKVAVYESPDAEGTTKDTLTLLPNNQVVYDRTSGSMVQEETDALYANAWKDNVLVLRDVRLSELKSILEDWYNVKITYQNQVDPNCLITGQFKDKSLREVLEAVRKINGYDYEIKGDQATIRNKPCN